MLSKRADTGPSGVGSRGHARRRSRMTPNRPAPSIARAQAGSGTSPSVLPSIVPDDTVKLRVTVGAAA